MKKKIFIECNNYHDEVLYGLIRAFGSQGDYVLINSGLNSSDLIEDLYSDYNIIETSKVFSIIKLFFCNRGGEVFFNTLETPKAILLFFVCLLFRYRIDLVSHNFDAFVRQGIVSRKKRIFRGLFGDLILSKSRKIYVLSESVIKWSSSCENVHQDLIKKIELLKCTGLRDFRSSNVTSNERYRVVIGSVDYSKRNYDRILAHLKMYDGKVYVLGNINLLDGLDFLERVRKLGLEERFKFFDYRVSYCEMIDAILMSEGVLMSTNKTEYGSVKVSASEVFATALNVDCIEV